MSYTVPIPTAPLERVAGLEADRFCTISCSSDRLEKVGVVGIGGNWDLPSLCCFVFVLTKVGEQPLDSLDLLQQQPHLPSSYIPG